MLKNLKKAAGKVFVFGWNDMPQNRSFPPEEIESLKRFRRSSFRRSRQRTKAWRSRIGTS
jgi:hypothetical protein